MHRAGISPVLEVRVHHPVGEALATNTDALKYTVTGELVHHEGRVDHTCQKSYGRESEGKVLRAFLLW